MTSPNLKKGKTVDFLESFGPEIPEDSIQFDEKLFFR